MKNEVQLDYNGFGQLVTEHQEHAAAVNTSASPKVQYGYADGSSNDVRATSLTYPDNRVISYDYGAANAANDVLSRLESIRDGATTLAGYDYLGLGSVVRVNYPQPQVRLDLWGGTSGAYAGLDAFGRIVDQKWVGFDGTSIKDQFQYTYDRNSNRTSKDNTLATDLDELYTYDNLDRLTKIERGHAQRRRRQRHHEGRR